MSKLGYQHLKAGRHREAEVEFRKILEIDHKNIYALVGIGDLYRGQRKYDNAIDYYQQALRVDPVNKFALIGLADTYRGAKQFNKAIEVWEDYLSYSENEFDIAVLTRLGDTYRKTGRFEQAIERYKVALSIDSKNPYALAGLGHLYFENRNYRQSLTYWHQLIEF
jgi:tetratricopeptide (TPR) repeat protein